MKRAPPGPSVGINSHELFTHIQAIADAVSWLDYEGVDKALASKLARAGEFLIALYELEDGGSRP
jgi:hypothetical protein